jgi:hypothetical protein
LIMPLWLLPQDKLGCILSVHDFQRSHINW